MFTVVNGVLLKPLPYPEPDRLVALSRTDRQGHAVRQPLGLRLPQLPRLPPREPRAGHGGVAVRAAARSASTGKAEYVSGRQISPELFSVLGVSPRCAAAPSCPKKTGRARRPSSSSATACGSAASRGSAERDRAAARRRRQVVHHRRRRARRVPAGRRGAGRLHPARPGPVAVHAEPQQASRHLGGRAPAARASLRRGAGGTGADRAPPGRAVPGFQRGAARFVAEPLRADVGDVRSTLWLLLGAVSLVLLSRAPTSASLLLARAVSRERELAMRVALGAGRGRLVRQCLTESAVLGLAGGALGVALAALGIRPFVALWPGSLPRVEEVQLDWRVLLFALAASLASGLAVRPGAGAGAPPPASWSRRSGPARGASPEPRAACTAASSSPRSRWPSSCWSPRRCSAARSSSSRPSTPASTSGTCSSRAWRCRPACWRNRRRSARPGRTSSIARAACRESSRWRWSTPSRCARGTTRSATGRRRPCRRRPSSRWRWRPA